MTSKNHHIIGEKVASKRPRAVYFAIYDLQGGPISPDLKDRLDSAILEVVKEHPNLAITATVE